MKPFLSVFLIVIIIGVFGLAGTLQLSTVQASTEVTGIINSDTTWTKANSPYTLTGPVGVTKGVTLTIEPGATVNLNNYYIQVNGTLHARGSSAEKIHFNGDHAEIKFTQYSPSWNEQIDSGSIIENAVLTSIAIYINDTSPKINNNSMHGRINCDYSSSIISNSDITGTDYPIVIDIFRSSAVISGNIIHNKHTAIESSSDSSIISNNTIIGGESGIIHNSISDRYAVSKNTVYGCDVGIDAHYFSTIEENLVINNGQGIVNRGASIIQNNTIANNTVGIYSYKPSTIIYNNIQDNSEFNIRLDTYARDNLNATFNWWGTTDTQAISQSIFDNKNDFNLGTVTFTPFLTAPNPEAPVATSVPPSSPPPTTSPSTTPTPSQEPQETDQTEAIVGAAIVVAVFGAGLGLLIYLIKRK